MAVENYGVLKGRVFAFTPETDPHNPHFNIGVRAGSTLFRVAVNVRSRGGERPDLLFHVARFLHPMRESLEQLSEGFHPLAPNSALAWDYMRGDLFDVRQMAPLPHDLPGANNDLNEKIARYVAEAQAHNTGATPARCYVFGSRWGPDTERTDPIFNFLPQNGMHNVHMNQGNRAEKYCEDNGIYQDGGLLFHFPHRKTQGKRESAESRRFAWIGIYLAFQAQSWQTDSHGDPMDL